MASMLDPKDINQGGHLILEQPRRLTSRVGSRANLEAESPRAGTAEDDDHKKLGETLGSDSGKEIPVPRTAGSGMNFASPLGLHDDDGQMKVPEIEIGSMDTSSHR